MARAVAAHSALLSQLAARSPVAASHASAADRLHAAILPVNPLRAAVARGASSGRSHVSRVNVSASAATEPSSKDLQAKFGKDGVSFDDGLGGLPRVILADASGSTAEVYLYGACTTSWKLPSGEDLLFVRPDAVFTGAKPISGGIPHCFPQFGPGAMQQVRCAALFTDAPFTDAVFTGAKPISGGIPHCFPQFGPGAMQQHGFARNLTWEVEAAEGGASPSLTLALSDNEYSRAMWDFAFKATFKISLSDGKLETVFTVTNTDSKPFSFTTALHSYFRAAIGGVKVTGLKGAKSLNKDPDPTNPIAGVEERDEVTFPGFVDCMYLNTPQELVLDNGLGRKLAIRNKGWTDAVVWSPHLTMPACYLDFVCVENAKLSEVELQAGQTWTAEQELVAL
ncbi:unnamed protein product [Closterium sp. NIES-65]|nr:unnamed protein product [Closterium sp. NIES-65]